MRFFGLSSCDTCRKALKELREAGLDPEVIDVRKDGIGEADRSKILDEFGEKALNRASATWRGLSEVERAESPATLLVRHPTLMKRPVIDAGERWFQGWTAAVRAALLPD